MKIFILIILSSITLFSCATGPLPSFNKDKNCSPRALKQIGQSPTAELTGQSNLDAFRAAQSCYHSLTARGYSGSHNICLVMSITNNGGFNFIDISDYDRPMGSDLQKCILDKMIKIDFLEFKNQTILQPLKVN